MRWSFNFADLLSPFIILFLVDGEVCLKVFSILKGDDFRLLESWVIYFDIELFWLLAFSVPH